LTEAKLKRRFVTIDGRSLEIAAIAGDPSRPTMVFLHEGLGSVSMWRDFPQRVSEATGCGALVYSRYGHGRSEVLEAARDVYYMHHEAQRVLPELLAELGIENPILFGHSDGASIAIIHAGARFPVRALILEAPHVFVEEISVAGVRAAREAWQTTDLAQKLARHHADAEKTFFGWADIWLDPAFRAWNIESFLTALHCPILAIQGTEDEYGTMAQLDAIAGATPAPFELLRLSDCGHWPHRQCSETTLRAVTKFVAT
jgi:pimeloyl-ACP methyl ester carboxylesterase